MEKHFLLHWINWVLLYSRILKAGRERPFINIGSQPFMISQQFYEKMQALHQKKMRKNIPYHKIIFVLLLQTIVLYSCSQNKNNNEHENLLSIIIGWDSVTVYSGKPGKNPSIPKIPIEETR